MRVVVAAFLLACGFGLIEVSGAMAGPCTIGDNDGDGLTNIEEDFIGNGDCDDDDANSDGIPNYGDDDDDADGWLTVEERDFEPGAGALTDPFLPSCTTPEDVDCDGLPNYYDPDSDGDLLPDGGEDLFATVDGDDLADIFDPDDDGDGIPTSLEVQIVDNLLAAPPAGWPSDPSVARDIDGDGLANYHDPDADGDGKPDGDEGVGDPDGDNIPNLYDADDQDGPNGDPDGDGLTNFLEQVYRSDPHDSDSDDDGILDGDEGQGDTDGDGDPNPIDPDDDGDGIPTAEENFRDLPPGKRPLWLPQDVQDLRDYDGDGVPNYLDDDSDGDGAPDSIEGTADGDGDGAPDYLGFRPTRVWPGIDPDGDRLGSSMEKLLATIRGDGSEDADGDGIVDYLDDDDDNDTVPTLLEIGPNAYPGPDALPDTDSDGTPDHLDPDDDGDGAPTATEDWFFDQDCDGTPNHLDVTDDRGFMSRFWQWMSGDPGCFWAGAFQTPR